MAKDQENFLSFFYLGEHFVSIFPVTAKSYPFRIIFKSDNYEYSAAANDEGTGGGEGFKLRYYQVSC